MKMPFCFLPMILSVLLPVSESVFPQVPSRGKTDQIFLQQVLIYAEEGDWNKTPALLRNMENTWQTAKSRMEKPDKELNEKIDFAVHDFSQAVRQKNIYLSRLKGEILFKNIEKIK